MNIFRFFRDALQSEIEALTGAGTVPAGLDLSRFVVEPPRDPAHGDLSSNAAMVLAKPAGTNPRVLAEALAGRLRTHPDVTEVTVAGPGFLNFRLADHFWHARLSDILRAGTSYGDSTMGAGTLVNVEYVSANPTGPLHVGHGRGAVFGDVLASLLRKAGFKVVREYYINDAGAQVDTLARSTYLRYREALGEAIGTIPEGLYPGDYLKETGRALAARDGARWLNQPEQSWLGPVRSFAVAEMMALIRGDLAALGVTQDLFSSERAVVESGGIEAALGALESAGLLYTGTLDPPKGKLPEDWEPRPQTLFKATQFGDDVDRPVKKSDGSWTYFAADIAYHFDKYRRGAAVMIDVLGADHGGYVKRMKAVVKALTQGRGELDVKLCQLVNLFDKGEPVRMSKRAGTFITLREVVDEVGKDAFRFMMLTRRNDQPLDFDFAKVTEQSKDNPVFYVQYAHARASSVLRHARAEFAAHDFSPAALAAASCDSLSAAAELALIRLLAAWPRLVESAAEAHEPHRIAFYLGEVAAGFHGLWNKGKDEASLRFIVADDLAVTTARLALVQAVALVIASGLRVFGVEPVEEMR
ncbi:MAG: arginine--tRNA ligase [Alphaproteobacteria bacterium]|nr:arginine--tRNA ligase [Alphaproteobacteria bacterium]